MNIDVLYQIAIDRLDAQIKRIDGIDANKIGMTFGLTNGITASLVAFITFIPRPVPQLVVIFATLAAIAYVVTLVFLFFAYRRGEWSFRPELKTLKNICTDPKYHDYPQIVKEWVAVECILSIERNSQPLTNKAKLADRPLVTLSIQGLFLAVAFVSYLFN